MTEIPTMACEACSGNGYVTKSDGPQTCRGCYGRRRIPRPPLTAEEIAALPDGARVVVEWAAETIPEECVIGEHAVDYGRRVWLADADPPPLCTICREHHGREVEHPCE